MYKYLILSVFSFLLLQGCAAIHVYRLHTIEQGNDIYMGIETTKKVDRNVEVLLQFKRQTHDYYEFYLSIKNLSDTAFIFNPNEIYSQPVHDKNKQYYNRYYVVDPEQHLNKIDKEINQTVSNKRASDGLNTFVAFLDFATSIATIGKKKTLEERHLEQENREYFARNVEDQEINYNNSLSSLNNEKTYWENEILRTTKYNPGDKIGGVFIMPIIQVAEEVQVIIPVNGINYIFLYKQTCV